MAHFYSSVSGKAITSASRLGSKSSGIDADIASWDGSVHVRMWHAEDVGRDHVRVSFRPWHGSGRDITLYSGPVNPTNKELIDGITAIQKLLGPLGREALSATVEAAD